MLVSVRCVWVCLVLQAEVNQAEERYTNGLTMLFKTESSVGKMQHELEHLQPQLEEAKAAAEVLCLRDCDCDGGAALNRSWLLNILYSESHVA